MARRTKCTFCGAPVDLSSTKCKFCNQDYDFQKKPYLKFDNLFNKKKFSIVKPKFKELKKSIKNNLNQGYLFIKNKSFNTKVLVKNNILITKDFIQKEFQKQRTKKIIFIYLPSFIFIILVAITVNKVLKIRQISYQEKIQKDKKIENDILKGIYLKEGYEKQKKSDLKGALNAYDKAIGLETNDPFPYLQKGKIYFSKKDYKSAISNLSNSIRNNKKGNLIETEIYLIRGQAYYQLKNFTAAIKDFTESLNLSKIYGIPNNKNWPNYKRGIYIARGYSNMMVGNNTEALKDINRALEIDPDFLKSENFLFKAAIKYESQDYEGAIKDANTALSSSNSSNWSSLKDKDKRIAQIYLARANSNAELGNYKNYCSDKNEAINLGGEEYLMPQYENIICSKELLKKTDDGKDSVFIANDISKEKYYLGKIKTILEKNRYKNPNELEKKINKSMSERLFKENCKQIYKLSNLLIEVSRNAGGYAYRAKSKDICQNNKSGALHDFSRALEIDPINSEYLNSRGILNRDLGKDEDAMKDFNNAISNDSPQYELFTQRGLTQYKIGNYKEAIKDFNNAIIVYRKENGNRYGFSYNYNQLTNLAKAKIRIESLNSALEDLTTAINYGSKDAYLFKGLVEYKLKDLDSACKSWQNFKDQGIVNNRSTSIMYNSKNHKIKRAKAINLMKWENYDENSSIYYIDKKYCL